MVFWFWIVDEYFNRKELLHLMPTLSVCPRATAFVWPPIVFHHIREILRFVFLFFRLFVVGGVEKGSKKVKLESQIQVLLNAKRTELK